MAETVDAIQEKLSPPHLIQQAKDTVRDATVGKVKDVMTSATDTASQLAADTQDRAQDAVRYIRDNPMPAALVGAGIAWLLMRERAAEPRASYPSRAARGYDRAPEAWRPPDARHGGAQDDWRRTFTDHPIRTALAGVGLGWLLLNRRQEPAMMRRPSATSRMAGETARQVRDTMGDVTETVQETWEAYSGRIETQFERWMRENPLTVGTAAVALGAAVGLAAPRTATEDAWLGEARDTLIESAQNIAENAVSQQTQQIVENAAERVVGGGGGTAARGAGA